MCGRYALYANLPALMARLGAGEAPPFPARYNIAPTQEAPVVMADGGGRRAALARFGLVPAWSDGPTGRYSMINARAETVANKPAYRRPYRARRCLVPASGFFEWRGEAGRKQPWYITRDDGEPMAFAGLWEVWRDCDGTPLTSFAIVTTTANDPMRPIHPRMPVILPAAAWDTWLDVGAGEPPGHLLRPYEGGLCAYPVATRVGSPAHDGPDLVEPLPGRE